MSSLMRTFRADQPAWALPSSCSAAWVDAFVAPATGIVADCHAGADLVVLVFAVAVASSESDVLADCAWVHCREFAHFHGHDLGQI